MGTNRVSIRFRKRRPSRWYVAPFNKSNQMVFSEKTAEAMCFLTAVLETGRLTFMVLAGGITRYGMCVRLSFAEKALLVSVPGVRGGERCLYRVEYF